MFYNPTNMKFNVKLTLFMSVHDVTLWRYLTVTDHRGLDFPRTTLRPIKMAQCARPGLSERSESEGWLWEGKV